jgi:hypothetical protein
MISGVCEMSKLIVCGCSLSADSTSDPGTGYGHQTARRLGWDVEILARQGCSNGGIRIQIDEALRQRPDFVIVAPTFSDRMEIPARSLGYSKQHGLDNINYGNNPYRMISEPIGTLIENIDHPTRYKQLDQHTESALQYYVNHLYDHKWKQQQDEWIVRDGIMQLFYFKIPFLVIAGPLWHVGNIRNRIPKVVNNNSLTLVYEETPNYAIHKWPFEGADPGYHGSPASQAYLAEIYAKKIRDILANSQLTDHK